MAVRVSLGALFAAFFRLGCTSFGGGTAGWLHRDMVERRRWIDDAAFLRAMAIAQALPGANGIKMSLLIGQQLWGMIGAVAALLALLTGPFLIILAIAALYAGIAGQPIVHAVLDGIAAAVIGLTFATGLRSLGRSTCTAGSRPANSPISSHCRVPRRGRDRCWLR
jgi:chromate transporter